MNSSSSWRDAADLQARHVGGKGIVQPAKALVPGALGHQRRGLERPAASAGVGKRGEHAGRSRTTRRVKPASRGGSRACAALDQRAASCAAGSGAQGAPAKVFQVGVTPQVIAQLRQAGGQGAVQRGAADADGQDLRIQQRRRVHDGVAQALLVGGLAQAAGNRGRAHGTHAASSSSQS